MDMAEGMGGRKTLAVYVGPHLAFGKFAQEAGAETFRIGPRAEKKQPAPIKALNFAKSALSIPPGYDLYLTETCYYYAAAAKRLGRIRGRIASVCSSPVFYNMLHGMIGGIERAMLLELAKDVDFFVLEGKYVGDVMRKLGIEKPSCLAYTYVGRERYETLRRMKPDLKSKEIAIIATNDYLYKGVDLLIEAVTLARKKDPGISLNVVVGNMDEGKISGLLSENMRMTHDAVSALSKAGLYVHPARGDVFPVAPLEAMLAGVPTMVSSETGTKEVVWKVRPDFVLPLEPEKIAAKINEYFTLSSAEKNGLSEKFRKAALPFNEKEQLAFFRKNYSEMLEKLGI